MSPPHPPPPPPFSNPTPILLLKTKSTPADSYGELFSKPHAGRSFAPRFVPVLLHRFEEAGLQRLRLLLRGRRIGTGEGCEFGGLIFTSQRAVEAFSKVAEEGQGDPSWPHLQQLPIYSVGPATTRALSAIPQTPPLQISGQHTGNGEALSHYIIPHYREWHAGRSPLPPLLFPVGEQRRDIIPKTLMDEGLPPGHRIHVAEEVIYGTGVMESFPADFGADLRDTEDCQSRWVVVFSPTGCDSMLRGLGILDSDTGRATLKNRDGKTFVATIGPTTRDYLVKTFGFTPDVCADVPSPEGVLQGIVDYEARIRDEPSRDGG